MYSIYQGHFGFTREPFNVTPDPSFLYLSASHKEALAQLVYGIKARRGFVVLTGEVGTGKTTLVHSLLQELNDGHTHSAFIFNLIGNQKDLLRSVCQDFALTPPPENQKEIHDYLTLLNRFLLESYRNGDNVALIIDEAQNLSAEVLESVRLLSNFETPQDKLLQILLVGQPELGARLNAPELRQVKQRVALRHHLRPLSLTECEEYIGKRLEIAGASGSVFTAKAIQAVHAYSGGIPRLINILCDNGLLTAYALRSKSVEVAMIGEIAKDLHLAVSPRSAVARPAIIPQPQETRPRAPKEENFQFTDLWAVEPPANLKIEQSIDKVGMKIEPATGENLQSTDKILHYPTKPGNEVSTEVESGSDTVPSQFFERLIFALTEAMGPMASLVVCDQVTAMGESLDAFPKQRLGQLVDEASREISSETLKAHFQQTISQEIHTINSSQEEQ